MDLQELKIKTLSGEVTTTMQKLSKVKELRAELREATKFLDKHIESHKPNSPEKASGYEVQIRWYYYRNDISKIPLCKCGDDCSYSIREKKVIDHCGKCYGHKISQTYNNKIMSIDNLEEYEYNRVLKAEKCNYARIFNSLKSDRLNILKRLYDNGIIDISIWDRYDGFLDELRKRTSSINYLFLDEFYTEDRKDIIRRRYFIGYLDISRFTLCPICKKSYNHYQVGENKFNYTCGSSICRSMYQRDNLIKNEGIVNISQREGVMEKVANTNIERYGVPYCGGKDKTSKAEQEILDYINNDLGIEAYKKIYQVEWHGKKFLEVDIFVPSLNIGFEYNGVYWHSDVYKDSTLHYNKKKAANDIGVDLYFIWETRWSDKKEIIKNFIKGKLVKREKIYARNCIVKYIDTNTSRNLCEKYHILGGNIRPKISIGLELGGEIISCITFIQNEGDWILNRYVVSGNYTILGGFQKMLSFFKGNTDADKIISYANFDYVSMKSNVYSNNGFELKSLDKSNYFYCIGNTIHNQNMYNFSSEGRFKEMHKSNFRKEKIAKRYGIDISNKTEDELTKLLGVMKCYRSGMGTYIKYL